MLRIRLPRRTLFVAAAGTALAVHDTRDKLPIYPIPEPEIVLLESPSELERHIGSVRRTVTSAYFDAYGRVQDVVSRWIGVEQAVEHRLKSLLASEEQLTPAILYIGVATLTGSVLARGRSFPIRFLLPPTLLVASSHHFLPKTTSNVSDYLGSLEDTYLPTVAEKHRIANAHTAMTWERIKDAAAGGRESVEGGLSTVVDQIQTITGLKLRDALSGARAQASQAARAAQSTAAQAAQSAEKTVEDAAHAVVEKVQEAAHSATETNEKEGEKSEQPAEAKEIKRLV